MIDLEVLDLDAAREEVPHAELAVGGAGLAEALEVFFELHIGGGGVTLPRSLLDKLGDEGPKERLILSSIPAPVKGMRLRISPGGGNGARLAKDGDR